MKESARSLAEIIIATTFFLLDISKKIKKSVAMASIGVQINTIAQEAMKSVEGDSISQHPYSNNTTRSEDTSYYFPQSVTSSQLSPIASSHLSQGEDITSTSQVDNRGGGRWFKTSLLYTEEMPHSRESSCQVFLEDIDDSEVDFPHETKSKSCTLKFLRLGGDSLKDLKQKLKNKVFPQVRKGTSRNYLPGESSGLNSGLPSANTPGNKASGRIKFKDVRPSLAHLTPPHLECSCEGQDRESEHQPRQSIYHYCSKGKSKLSLHTEDTDKVKETATPRASSWYA